MSEDQPVVRAIAWREVFPWLRLSRVFRLAIRPRVLLVAILAALVANGGWRVIAAMFSRSDDPRLAIHVNENSTIPGSLARIYTDFPWEPTTYAPVAVQGDLSVAGQGAAADLARTLADPAASGYASLGGYFATARPIQQLLGFGEIFDIDAGLPVTAFLLMCLLWAIAVWAVAGGIITRIAAVAITRGEQISWNRAVTFAKKKWLSYFASPLLPIAGVLLITLFMAIVGLLMQIPYVGVALGAILWPLMLIGGLLIAILLLGLVASWPLMWCTISCEGTDSFDALGRSYGYLFGRPLRYLGYALIAFVFGWLGWWVVSLFANLIVQSTLWAASWGATTERIKEITQTMVGTGSRDAYHTYELWFANLIWFFNSCVRALPAAFLFSFFWTAATMIYLLLRRDEDQTEMDEVWLEDEQETYGLPPLRTDAAGVPEPADIPAPPASAMPAVPPPAPDGPGASPEGDRPIPL